MKKVLVVTALAATAVTVPQVARAETCATRWGSQPKTVTSTGHTTLTAVRQGHSAALAA